MDTDDDADVTRLTEAVLDAAGQDAIVVLRGGAASGKSGLLAKLSTALRGQGRVVLSVSADGRTNVDFTERLRDVTREHFERVAAPGLLTALGNLGTVTVAHRTNPGSGSLAMAHEIANLVKTVTAKGPGVLIVDDLHRFDRASVVPLYFAADRLRRAGVTVVVGQREVVDGWPVNAGQVVYVDVVTLSESQQEQLVARCLRARPDRAVMAVLRNGLGPLAGRPTTLVAATRRAVRDSVIGIRAGHAFLAGTVDTAPIVLPDDHHLVRSLRRADPLIVQLATAVAVLGGVRLSDLGVLIEAFDLSPVRCRRALDRLAADGTLRAVDEPRRLEFTVPALAATLAADCKARDAQMLRALMVQHLIDRVDSGDLTREPDLADHIAAAKWQLDQPDPAPRLFRAAEKAVDGYDRRTVEWYRAALSWCRPDEARWQHALRMVLAGCRQLGWWQRLAEIASNAFEDVASIPVIPANLLTDLVVHWVSALLQLGRAAEVETVIDRLSGLARVDPVAADLATRLTTPAGGAVGLGSTETATLIDHPLGPALSVALSAVLGRGPTEWDDRRQSGVTAELADMWSALAWGDIPALFERITPGLCGAAGGTMRPYHLMRLAFAEGDWDAALRLGHEVEFRAGPQQEVYVVRVARAMAALIDVHRGNQKRAVQSAALLDPELDTTATVGATLVAAARCATAWAAGHDNIAYSEGRLAYQRFTANDIRPGTELLVELLIELGVRLGHRDEALAMTTELRRLLAASETPHVRRVVQRADALLHNSAAAAHRSLLSARWLGQPYRIAQACLLASEFDGSSDELLHEALAIFHSLGSARGRGMVAEALRHRGSAVPRRRRRTPALSAAELQVIELVSAGETNRRIAVELRVSEKTVEGYLTKLFGKTGCRTRVELAAARLTGALAS